MSDSFHLNKDDYIYPNKTPIVLLRCEEAFNELTDREKLYAHYLNKASWVGGLIVLLQTSQESPLIYCLLHRLFRLQSVKELKEVALNECDFTEEDFTAFLVYTCGIFFCLGNYKGFSETKFIPNLPKEKFEKLIRSSKFAKDLPKNVERLLSNCLENMYSLTDTNCRFGFSSKGVTKYLSKNITEEDDVIVKNFMKEQNIEAWNTRLIKTTNETGRNCYEIRLASTLQQDGEEDQNILIKTTSDGHDFIVTRGDYSPLLELVNWNLSIAKRYAANENQEKMIENYIHSFRTGSLKAHKDGSRFWVKDKGPVVESYIGFIENYRDPSGMRAEFEGFVAIVNKKMSAKFTDLVNSAEVLLPLLPWPSSFEKDTFMKPDFTSLDVLTFASSCLPAGINIPNYYEVKEKDGFKNVSLGNVVNVKPTEPPNYLKKVDQDIFNENINEAFELTVGLHELLGHGSGKDFMEETDGSFNFDVHKVINYETDKEVTSWYKKGETYSSIFGALSSAMEECRADSVALYLGDVAEILKIFGHEGEKAETIKYTVWLNMVLGGLQSLQKYHPKSKKWLQAHAQGRYAILNVLLEAGEDFVKLEETTGDDGKPDLLITMDPSKITNVGKPAIGKFLKRIQLYRSTADYKSANDMFEKYTAVTSESTYPFLNYREIILARKKPTKIFVLPNTVVEGGKIVLKSYEETYESMIESWTDRFQDAKIDSVLEELWEKDRPHFS